MGDLVRRPCEICTSIGRSSDRRKTVAHHEDYDRLLEVRWLCHGHHQQVHRGTICLLSPSGPSGVAALSLPGDVAFRALAR
jgi:hypothetical protein